MKTKISKPKRIICIFFGLILVGVYHYCLITVIAVFQKEIIIPLWQTMICILGGLGVIIGALIVLVLGITGFKE